MRYLLSFLLFFILSCNQLFAQHYSCVSSEYKTYFTNSRGYLRGMRIDSAKVINGSTVYYPFLTARTGYQAWSQIADTTGGSWWGREIVETPEDLTYLLNNHNDTILIKNMAVPGDSWTFFSDTANTYYVAEVISVDTQTFGSVLDSVKLIKLTAFDENNLIVDDSINGIELRLSKHYGLITAIDFYLFPYRQSAANWMVDCYFFEAMGKTSSPDKEKLTFNYIDFKVPDSLQIFNFDSGHVYHSYYNTDWSGYNSNYSSTKTIITGKAEMTDSIVYTYNFWRKIIVYPPSSASYTTYDSGVAGSFIITKGLLMDTTYMPEQWYSGKNEGVYYYYFPNDSSFCLASPRYDIVTDVIINNRFGGGGPEPSFPDWKYKEGIGEIKYDSGNGQPEGQDVYRGISAVGVLSNLCDVINAPVSIAETRAEEIRILLYPNPANAVVHLKGPPDLILSVSLYDIFGKKIGGTTGTYGVDLKMDVSVIPSGMYFARISGNGRTVVRKFAVMH